MSDTIFALSSGRPPAAIAVVRISGAAARTVGERVAGRLPRPRRASLRRLRDAEGELLDQALVLWLPGPATATGEDLLELHLHGGRAIVAAVETAVAHCPGVRQAEPGEFTRRALSNGRIDLAQAEGLADLLEAETEAQRRTALAATDGMLSAKLHDWLDRITAARAMIEAQIDYDDAEVELARDRDGDVDVLIDTVRDAVEALLARPSVERLAQGLIVTIAGPPNAGKSSLFNALTQSEAAIVTPIAGTTRDRIDRRVLRSGLLYTLCDTAGFCDRTVDPVEAEGIRRSHLAVRKSDVVLWLDDVPPPAIDGKAYWLKSRCDLPERDRLVPGQIAMVSSYRPDTIDGIWCILERHARVQVGGDPLRVSEQQRATLRDLWDTLDGAPEYEPVVKAERLRRSAWLLATLLGVNATEMMLDALFGRFCLGK